MKIFDCVVIGAGVVGASVFNKLVRVGKSVLMIDKASDVATGASKANSGIVHAGYDPKPGTLKAKLNVRGNRLYPKICKRLGVKLKKCGALVVGDNKDKIEELYKRGLANGAEVEIWQKEKINEKIPSIDSHISVALFAKNSYIVSPYLLTIALTEEAILNGGKVCLEEDIKKIEKNEDIFQISTQKNMFFCKNIVNSAGKGYNDVAKMLGSETYDLEFRKGEYFVFESLPVSCTIFPLPTKLGKGVLITPTADGKFLVGPTSEEGDKTSVSRSGLEDIKTKARMIFPDINFSNSIRQFAGVRTICGEDFVVEKSSKISGVVNLAGICSPGLTSAPAIAEMVTKLLGFSLKEKQNLRKIQPYLMFKDMTKTQQNELLKNDKNFKQIVCKCECITKGDVLRALNRPLKISTVDGIKRRTGAGMGRCQGGFCFVKVAKIISEKRKIDFEKVLKENRGSEIAIGDLRGGTL